MRTVSDNFGLIPDGPEMLASAPVELRGSKLVHTAWAQYTIPVHGQGRLPSCAGHAWANVVELLVIRDHGKGVFGEHGQLNGDAVWERAREMFHGGSLDGGLTLKQAFLACKDLGILDPDCGMETVGRDLSRCCEWLDHAPLVVGHRVWPDWYGASRENGYIAASPIPSDAGGHAVVLDRVLEHGGEPYPGGINSWEDFGWHSLYCMSLGMWQASIVSVPVAPVPGAAWKSWRGWERHLIEVRG